MSRLTDLLAQAKAKDPGLGAELEREFKALSSRRAFGLNFERHKPESVELPGRPVRKGDKVRILPPRGTHTKGDTRLWSVRSITRKGKMRTAHLELVGEEKEEQSVDVADVVVVAEFKDFIYPGLVSTGKIERGGDRPYHTVINGENYHALEALTFTHRGKVDVIYIDPPYNTGAKDWKYNNDYVESEDLYRHSKWLAMMERRLLVAKELLNPADSVLIVTIDEKEYLRLGLLLEQTFPEARIQMVSILINGAVVSRANAFGRSDEYAFFVSFGSAAPSPAPLGSVWSSVKGVTHRGEIRWDRLIRSGTGTSRKEAPGCYYPVYVSPVGPSIVDVGSPIPNTEPDPERSHNVIPVLPKRSDGSDGRWQMGSSELIRRIAQGRVRVGGNHWHEDADKHAFSLTATTGAGKTVMAAAVFESLFFGSSDYECAPDPTAVVIWFSDDPSLNEQSRWRLQEASDKLTVSDLVTVGSSFIGDKFQAGKVYFLNTQKLSKNSLLVRGHDPNDPALETNQGQMTIMPDMRQHTIWDVIRNTIEDPDLTLYLVLDEAHRGMREGGRTGNDGKSTIVRQLINGTCGVPGIPVVWGISATVQRFNDAVAGMQGRSTLPHVEVDPKKVQESGLLKDTINLDVPDETGDFTTVLLRRGTQKLREVSRAWKQYGEEQGDAEKVVPLMVLQVPNSPDPTDIAVWLDTIFKEWPELTPDAVANVFGEHKTEEYSGYKVPYIAPERVQESDWVRVLLAKDAISTGWDCPRAEVMVSFRHATDKTHITQLLGRMVRTPLARRVPGNDRLNAVDCLLPHFDKKSVQAVVTGLMTGESGEPLPERRVLINPKEMLPNPSVPEKVWAVFASLPSQTLPKRQTRPVKRLTALAHELAYDGLLKNAGQKAHKAMHKVLDASQKKHAKEIQAARASVLTVEGKTVRTDVETQGMTFDDFVEHADMAVIEDAYRVVARMFSPDVTRTYAEHLAGGFTDAYDEEEALIEAHTVVASLGLVVGIKYELEKAAAELATNWLEEYRPEIRKLSDERQEIYREIREMSAEPLDVDLAVPKSWLQATTELKANGREEKLPHYKKHLLCDEDGTFPVDHNSWEEKVITTELKNSDMVGWYRNPGRPSQDSLGITYSHGDEQHIVRPDFIFFYKQANGKIVADIVDPHGTHLDDSLAKIKGMATYVMDNPKVFRRVLCCGEREGTLMCVDLADARVRTAVLAMDSIHEVYKSDGAQKYM